MSLFYIELFEKMKNFAEFSKTSLHIHMNMI